MSTSNSDSLVLHIYGKDYHIKCPKEKQTALLEAAQFLNTTMRDTSENGQVRGTERVAIMTALHLAHELLSLKQDNTNYIHFVGQKVQNLHKKIEDSLSLQPQLEL